MDEVPICWVGTCTTPAHPAHDPCCSSKFHQKPLCCEHYRRFHFVETGCGHEEAPAAVEKVRIYIDVDGVINACQRPGFPDWGWESGEHVRVNGSGITYSPAFVSLLNGIAARPGACVYWVTTWCYDAPQKLAPAIGLDGAEWPVVGYHHWTRAIGLPWWKHLAIVDHLEISDPFDGPVLWIDDDHGVDPHAVAWLRGQPRVQTIVPKTLVGVTRDQGQAIETFVSEAIGARS